MNNRAKIIRERRKALQLSQQELAKLIGAKGKGVISQWEQDPKGNAIAISAHFQRRLRDELGVPECVLDIHAGRDKTSKHSLGNVIGVNFQPHTNKEVHQIGWGQIGDWVMNAVIREDSSTYSRVTTSVDAGDRAFALQVKGDSMLPAIPDGFLVIVDPDEPYRDGDYVIARIDDAPNPVLRRVTIDGPALALDALKPGYPAYHSTAHKIQTLGTVVEIKITLR